LELAFIRSDISRAGSTTSSGGSASSDGRSLAEFFEFKSARSASSSQESAALALAEPIRLSVVVIRDVPARTFEHGEGEFGISLLVN